MISLYEVDAQSSVTEFAQTAGADSSRHRVGVSDGDASLISRGDSCSPACCYACGGRVVRTTAYSVAYPSALTPTHDPSQLYW